MPSVSFLPTGSQSRYIISLLNGDGMMRTKVPGDDDQHLQHLIPNQNFHIPCGYINPDAVCMSQPNVTSNDRRNNYKSNIDNDCINIDRNHINPTNIVDGVVRVLFMFAECFAQCIEVHESTECCLACRHYIY